MLIGVLDLYSYFMHGLLFWLTTTEMEQELKESEMF